MELQAVAIPGEPVPGRTDLGAVVPARWSAARHRSQRREQNCGLWATDGSSPDPFFFQQRAQFAARPEDAGTNGRFSGPKNVCDLRRGELVDRGKQQRLLFVCGKLVDLC